MNKQQLMWLTLPPLLMLIGIMSVTYIFWQMEREAVASKSDLPSIERFLTRIENEKGINTKEKLLSFTTAIHGFMSNNLNNNINIIKLYKNLLLFILMCSLIWLVNIYTVYKQINKNSNK